jgi:6-phosphogluconolactonase/glucosamine-6-phosphate isomerase/deaminase
MQITFEGELSPMHPASVIRLHPDCATFCDEPAAAKLCKLTQEFCAK